MEAHWECGCKGTTARERDRMVSTKLRPTLPHEGPVIHFNVRFRTVWIRRCEETSALRHCTKSKSRRPAVVKSIPTWANKPYRSTLVNTIKNCDFLYLSLVTLDYISHHFIRTYNWKILTSLAFLLGIIHLFPHLACKWIIRRKGCDSRGTLIHEKHILESNIKQKYI